MSTAETSPRRRLPRPELGRWQPLRGGLVNLFRFDAEEFWYEKGRLLLRGNNGTGKSRVLALQLPFLLDGETAPHRLEPDGDPAKKIAWNLLLDKYPDRLGYTWIEFGRLDEQGEARYRTLGCGLSAVQGRGLTDRWFFSTDRRLGDDLSLTAAGAALSRPRLVEALGDRGEVFTTATSYRRAVDEALFGLGEHRYGALLDLLIQLRQPQLSRHLDEKRLSAALSEALPPLSASLVGDIAESFRGLEDDKRALAGLRAASLAVKSFLDGYRRYSRIASRRRAAGVRHHHAAYESTQRRLRDAEGRAAVAEEQLELVTRRLAELVSGEAAADAEVDTLRQSPEMRDARALEEAGKRAEEKRREADRAAAEAEVAATELEDHRARRQQAETAVAGAWRQAEQALAKAAEGAGACGLAREHAKALEPIGLRVAAEPVTEGETGAESAEPEDRAFAAGVLDTAAELLDELSDRRRRSAERLLELGRDKLRAARELTAAKELQARLSALLDEAVRAQREAHDELGEASGQLLAAYRQWHAELRELRPPGAAELEAEIEQWSHGGEGKSPIGLAVAEAESEAGRRLAAEQAALEQRLEAARDHLEALDEHHRQASAGVHQPPPAPPTRDPEARQGRPGAPLFMLCELEQSLDPAESAGLEAALQDAGLLDAWVLPDGRLLSATDHDTVLAVGRSPRPERHLGAALRPAADRDDRSISDELITEVLGHIGLGAGSGTVWVDPDGRWQAGPLHGAWNKENAEHLGAAAREARRRRRLAELDREIAAGRSVLGELEDDAMLLTERRRQIRREAQRAPDDSVVHRARAGYRAASDVVDRQRGQLADTETRVAERRAQLERVEIDERRAAEDLGVERWIGRAEALQTAVAAFRESLAALWPTLRRYLDQRQRAAEATRQVRRADEQLQNRRQLHADAKLRADKATVERDTLQQSVGARVEDIVARLDRAEKRLQGLRRDHEAGRQKEKVLSVELGVASNEIDNRRQELAGHDAARAAAIEAFGRLAAAHVLAVAMPELRGDDDLTSSVARAVEVARRVEVELVEVDSDDPAWDRVQRRVHQQIEKLKDELLPHDVPPEVDPVDGLYVVTAPFRGRRLDMAALQDAVEDAAREREQILSAKEKEVLENHLIGEVSSHLHERLRAAEELVEEMNRELASRPMSTGMALRFAWHPRPDGPEGVATARRHLLANMGTWSPRERGAVGEFLQRTIHDERAKDETGTWQEHLEQALDYRAWHQFSIERRQDGQWRRLTRRTHGTGSGGEKAIALTVPQFAAASAHYNSARQPAPRLILLDEAFVGVDADMRAKCMGLLHAFDLDFVMTSEREWGCYATLPGIAIHQLSTLPGIEAVGVSRWVWNGQERRREDIEATGVGA